MERALLFTDIVDSTRFGERVGDARAAEIWAAHDQRAREAIKRHRGREIDRADGFFVLFDDARDAIAFALDYHAAIAALGLSARAALHVGGVTLRENAPEDVARGAKPLEVEGIAKPMAARVMTLAVGGQTLATSAALAALGEHVPPRTRVESHGWYRLKGFGEPVEVFEIGEAEVAAFAPPGDSEKAYRVVARGELWVPVREVRHNLPAERDAFVGRALELRRLAQRLDAGVRLLTVLGPGGTGKTRLVRRYGWTWLGDWPGGVYFCDLSEARSVDGVYFAVGSTLEVQLGRGDSATQLGNAIIGRGRCVVILDNFEQVVEHAAVTVGRWLDDAPEATFVVTSRERLLLPGEEVFPVEPLDVSDDAVELFAIRARAQRPDFILGEAQRAAVAEVVRLLDGLPLAIELAAARVRIFSPSQLVERMRDRFALLAGARGASARQATLRAAIDWSWDLLTLWEQSALAQCGIFDGGFTLEAAESVLDLSRWREAPPVMDVVQALADKSLLRTWLPAGQSRYDFEEPYFGMYLTIREYAAEKLARDQAAATRAERRHGSHFAAFGTEEAIESLSRHGGTRRRRTLAIEIDNLVGACRRAARRGDASTAVAALRATWEVLELSGPAAQGVTLGAEVLGMPGLDAPSRASALAVHARALRRVGRGDEASIASEEALARFRAAGDRRQESAVLVLLGNLRRDQGRSDESRAFHEAARGITQETGNRRLLGYLLGNLGILHAEQGRLDQACALFEQAIAIHREVGNHRIEGIDTCNLGAACVESGRFDEARVHLTRALEIHREGGSRRDIGVTLANLGLLHASQQRRAEARPVFEEALTFLREAGDRIQEAHVGVGLANVLRDEGRVAEGLAQCERALAVSRAIGNRRLEGGALATQAELLAAQSRFAEAREVLVEGETLLRAAGDAMGLANLLCTRALTEIASGNPRAAHVAAAAAEGALAETSAGADSDAARRIAALRDQLKSL